MDRPSAIYESEKQLKALADVLEGKEYKNTGATRGQSKWLKYIAELMERNQLFGIKMTETEIMPEQTFTFIENEGVRVFEGSVTLNGNNIVLGEIYDVKIDDALYKVECRDLNGVQILGDATFIVTGNPNYDDTGEPFVIRLNFYTGDIYGITALEAGDHTISINGLTRTIIKIPKAFLPDDIGAQVQADWNQNNDTADDYIKNRPFYESTQSVTLLDGTFVFVNSEGMYMAQPEFAYDLIEGESYTVTFDNVTYKCSTINLGEMGCALGNLSIAAMGEDTGEPFLINMVNHTYFIVTNTSVGNHSVSVVGNAIVSIKVPEKYLPPIIGRLGTGKNSEIFNNHNKSVASGEFSHAEGSWATAQGNSSHAEGTQATARGFASHAEGDNTIASGRQSHAEGRHTIAASEDQHVQGKYNIEDTAGTYAHIVGNGSYSSDDSARSNAHTLDWSGNAWFAGTVEGTAMIVKSSTEGSSKRFKITVDDSGVITATEITA